MSTEVELKAIRPTDHEFGAINPAYAPSTVSSEEVGVAIRENNNTAAYDHAVDDDTSSEVPKGTLVYAIYSFQTEVYGFAERRNRELWTTFWMTVFGLYMAYFIYAMIHEKLSTPDSVQLLWMTCVGLACILGYLAWTAYGPRITEAAAPCCVSFSKHSTAISWVILGLIYLFVVVFLIVDVTLLTKKPNNLISLVGIFIYITAFFIFSYDPSKIQWRAVLWGMALQSLFAVFILRWEPGYDLFKWIGDRVATFLSYTIAGSKFVFGEYYYENYFAFVVLPTIVFFSTFISILYYLGVMQVIVKAVAMVMQAAMGTTAGESLNAAGNIFVGQTEAPLMIRPLLADMTDSELHAVMTGGFATIAGGVLAAYIAFGVPANHLISASVMSAPAALAMAKLLYPETTKSKTTAEQVSQHLPDSEEVNVIQAAAAGASSSIVLVANVAANLIAFLAILAFVDGTLTWMGHRVGVEGITFEWFCSWIFMPFAYIMGVEWKDCHQVARLMGIKTFLNEFIAYDGLGKIVKNGNLLDEHRKINGTWYEDDPHIYLEYPDGNSTMLEYGVLSDRSVTISTYALCGFANIGSIGIQLGGLGAMAPEKIPNLARVAVRAMIAGTVACFLTACIAGLFYVDRKL